MRRDSGRSGTRAERRSTSSSVTLIPVRSFALLHDVTRPPLIRLTSWWVCVCGWVWKRGGRGHMVECQTTWIEHVVHVGSTTTQVPPSAHPPHHGPTVAARRRMSPLSRERMAGISVFSRSSRSERRGQSWPLPPPDWRETTKEKRGKRVCVVGYHNGLAWSLAHVSQLSRNPQSRTTTPLPNLSTPARHPNQ